MRTWLDHPLDPTLYASSSRDYVKASNIGKANLYVVRQKIARYLPKDIAHIENILKGEKKERTHRTFERSEMTFTTKHEKVEEEKNELETTERFELDKESQEIMKRDVHLEGGVDVTASYGSVKINSHVNAETDISKEEKEKTASNYARETINKAVSSIQERVFEERKRKLIRETEITNFHELNNKDGTENIRGIYRWLDKIYDVELVEAGERLMFDFIIPEPARYYKYALKNKSESSEIGAPPDPPLRFFDNNGAPIENAKEPLLPEHITTKNYQLYAAKYGSEVVIPPYFYKHKAVTIKNNKEDSISDEHFVTKKVSLPSGYKLVNMYAAAFGYPKNDDFGIEFRVQDSYGALLYPTPDGVGHNTGKYGVPPIKGEDQLAIMLRANYSKGYAVIFQLKLERTWRKMDEWRNDMYKKINEAYMTRKAEYEDKLAAKRAIQQTEMDFGTNPQQNKAIITNELKKHVISIFRGNHFEDMGVIVLDGEDVPNLDFNKTEEQANEIQFFEHAIEWKNMMQILYPYYWADKGQWVKMLHTKDDDFHFQRFLQAGAARVVVPIRPGYEDAIKHYIQTGEVYNGTGERPDVDDEDEFLPIWKEIRELQHTNDTPEPIIDTYKAAVPTSLVYLEEKGNIADITFEEF